LSPTLIVRLCRERKLAPHGQYDNFRKSTLLEIRRQFLDALDTAPGFDLGHLTEQALGTLGAAAT